ncbi:MAG: hypothetical protein K6E86_05100 [Bacteroidales bacterium]|nr:hypothetical protein [Bacteroidales bacterium]
MVALSLRAQIIVLPEVEYKAPIVIQHGDTLGYMVNDLTAATDRTLEDILRRIPGVDIRSDGTITYQDKPINHFYIEGMDLLDSKYTFATRNLKPEDLNIIEILEDHQPIKSLRDYLPSNRGAINVKLKKDRLSRPIGYAQAGGGWQDDQVEEMANVQLMSLSRTRQMLCSVRQREHWFVPNSEMEQSLLSDVSLPYALQLPWLETLLGTPQIAEKRYRDNELQRMQCNMLRKTKRDSQLRLIVSLGNEHNDFSQQRSGLYYLGQNYASVLSRASSHLSAGEADVQFKYEYNADTRYVKHLSTFQLNRDRQRYTVGTQYDTLHTSGTQLWRSHAWQYVGNTTFIARSERNAMQWDVNMYAGETPSTLGYDALGHGLSQHCKAATYAADAATTLYVKWLKKCSTGAELKANYQHHSLQSDFDWSTGSNAISDANRCRYTGVTATLNPFIRYTGQRLDLRLDLPVSLSYIEAENTSQQLSQHLSPLLIGAQLIGQYTFTPLLKLRGMASSQQQSGDITDLMTAPLWTSYLERVTMGDGSMPHTNQQSGNLQLIYRNQLDGTTCSLSADVLRTSSSHLANSCFEDGLSIDRSTRRDNAMGQTRVSANAFQNFYVLEWTLRLTGSYTWQHGDAMRNSLLYNLRRRQYNATLQSEKFLLNRRLCIQNGVSFSAMQIDYNSEASALDQDWCWSTHHRIFFNLNKHWQLRASTESQWRNIVHWHPDHYVDASLNWTEGHHEVELCLNNLSDNNRWTYSLYDGLNYYTYRYNLRRREVTLSYKYNL